MTDAAVLPVPTLSFSQRIVVAGLFAGMLALPLWALSRFALALGFEPTPPVVFAAALLGLVQATLLCGALARRMRARRLPLLATYEWYVKSFPRHVHDGQLSCRSCGSFKKAVRSFPQDVRLRGHWCGSCNGLLYVVQPAD